MNIIQSPSSNFDDRKDGRINFIILHHTEMNSAQSAIDWLCDPEAEVSSHYLIDKAGPIHQLVPDGKKAWHAGKSYWKGVEGLNDTSVGIELDNAGYQGGLPPFPKVQMQALIELLAHLCKKHNIPRENIIGHADIAPSRKRDPSEVFDWKWLYDQGIGIWPSDTAKDESTDDITWVQQKLAGIGYYCPVTGELDEYTSHVIQVFRLHFIQKNIDGKVDQELLDLLARF